MTSSYSDTRPDWIYDIQWGPEGQQDYAHVFERGWRLVAVMKTHDAARVATHRGAFPDKETGWRPIETAPRTSRAILVYVPENKSTFCVTWDRQGWQIFGGGWRSFLDAPSHWMPLPPPPSVSEEKES